MSDERIEKFLMDEAKANSESVPLLESLSFSSEQHPVSRAATFRQPLFNVRTALSQCAVVVITGAEGFDRQDR
ncbi:TPA: hypothetical protein MHZ58_28640 [Klebsiella pneumoniae subsp. pneumoniae]|nr:hypothetical protein [Klebsiella pneumoniae subsp. pneumoniae]